MTRPRPPVQITLPPDLLEQLDAWRMAQFGQPNRSQVIEGIIREFLETKDD